MMLRRRRIFDGPRIGPGSLFLHTAVLPPAAAAAPGPCRSALTQRLHIVVWYMHGPEKG